MLIYDRFIFIHMPKTGGKFLTEVLERELGPPLQTLTIHTGWNGIPADAAGLPILMFVRNPWDWYVSWYHYYSSWIATQSPEWLGERPLLRLIFGENLEFKDGQLRGVADFATSVRKHCVPLDPRNPVAAEIMRDAEPAEEGPTVASLLAAGDDIYTTQFKFLAGSALGTDQLTVGRFETLVDDLERFLTHNEMPLSDDALQRISATEPVNATLHRRPYRDYYDDDLRDLVGRSCRTLVERFDYTF